MYTSHYKYPICAAIAIFTLLIISHISTYLYAYICISKSAYLGIPMYMHTHTHPRTKCAGLTTGAGRTAGGVGGSPDLDAATLEALGAFGALLPTNVRRPGELPTSVSGVSRV